MKSNIRNKVLNLLSITVQIVLIIVCSMLLIRNVCYEAIVVSQSSMDPTLKDGDYGYAIKTKYALDNIHRFDIIIFNEDSKKENNKLIKRVIGLPGETIEFRGTDCSLYVNDEKIEQNFISLEEQSKTGNWNESRFYQIPENSYFVLGDNRGVSYDSRSFGCIEKEAIFGILKVVVGHYTNFDNGNYDSKELGPFRYF